MSYRLTYLKLANRAEYARLAFLNSASGHNFRKWRRLEAIVKSIRKRHSKQHKRMLKSLYLVECPKCGSLHHKCLSLKLIEQDFGCVLEYICELCCHIWRQQFKSYDDLLCFCKGDTLDSD